MRWLGHLALACYRPKPGQEAALLELMRTHLPILRAEGLATSRASIAGRAKDGTIIEMFEWVSKEAIDAAHTNPAVLAMWERFAPVCDYVRLADVAESADLFCMLEAIDVSPLARGPVPRPVRSAKRAARVGPAPARKGRRPARPSQKARPPKRSPKPKPSK